MDSISRFKFGEISCERVISAVLRRFKSIPHKIAWNITKKGRSNRHRLDEMKNINAGKRCFLIANGPSLLKTDINKLSNEITFGLNRIYLNYNNMCFKPTYLVCVNMLVLKQFALELKSEKMPLFINWQSRRYFKDTCNTFFLENNIFGKSFSKNISYSINPAATVTYAALQIIYYMGFKEVIIVGMDHTFSFQGKPNETQVRVDEKDQNHFSPNYFPKGVKWETPDLVSTEYFYKIADQEFKKDGRRIYDATVNGKCTVFEKIEYDSIF